MGAGLQRKYRSAVKPKPLFVEAGFLEVDVEVYYTLDFDFLGVSEDITLNGSPEWVGFVDYPQLCSILEGSE